MPTISHRANPRHLLDIDDLSPEELAAVLDLSEHASPPQVLSGRGVALVFEKPSLRTRHSFEVAVTQVGGRPVTATAAEVGIDTRESAEDIGRTLAGYHGAIAARVFEHHKVERMAAVSSVPVVNLLSDTAHPCQTLADLLTIRQHFGALEGVSIAWVGDGNNVCRSLVLGAAMSGMDVRVATPAGYQLGDAEVARARAAAVGAGRLTVSNDAARAVDGADVVYTDVWSSMGQEGEAETRRRAFAGFTVDGALMSRADPGAIFLHPLPVHRGEEVTEGVCDGPGSRIWQLAENRMHAARGLLVWLFTG